MALLSPSQVPAAVELLVRAFDEDPFFRFLAPDLVERQHLLNAVMSSFLTLAVPRGVAGTVLSDERELRGICVWYPPRAYPPPLVDTLRAYAGALAQELYPRRVRAETIRRVLRMGSLVDEAQPEQPHFYLQLLAVDPRWHGRGTGSSMLRERVAQADRAGLPALIETSKEMNLRLYQRFGFEVVQTTSCDSSPPVWTMWRSPGASARGAD